jgi:protein involved in polysaccharide export with SLBB domain
MLSGGLLDTTFTKSVYLKSGQIIRKNIDSRFETVLKVDINDLIDNSGDSKIKLQNLDRFVIHPNLNFYERENIIIEGQVKIPGSYPLLSEKESLSDLIQRAGGISKGATENGISIHRLNKYFDFINEADESSLSQDNRIKLAWENLNVKLMPGDSIIVKESPMTVIVSGQVYNPGLVEYVSNRSLRKYINLAGGITNEGDKDNIIITYPNGVVRPKKWYSSPQIKDGSQIIVNAKPPQEPFNLTQFATNWTSIISSMITAVILSQQLSSQ